MAEELTNNISHGSETGRAISGALGNAVGTGFGVKTPSYFKALELYLKSANQGDVLGQYSLGKMYEEDHRQDEAIENYRLAAAQGNPYAIDSLQRLGIK